MNFKSWKKQFEDFIFYPLFYLKENLLQQLLTAGFLFCQIIEDTAFLKGLTPLQKEKSGCFLLQSMRRWPSPEKRSR